MLADKKKIIVALCGGGNAVHVLAADLGASKRYDVRIFAPFADEAERMKRGVSGGITKHFRGSTVVGKPLAVSKYPEDVIPGADVVILPIPSFAHKPTLEAIGPYLKEDAIVGAIPGQGDFDLTAHSVLGESKRCVTLFGFNQLPYQCRIREYGESVDLIGHKRLVKLATSPRAKATDVAALFSDLLGYVKVEPLDNFLAVTLYPANQVIHPCIMYGLFRDYKPGVVYGKPPLFYQNTDEFTAEMLTGVSNEVQEIAHAIQDKTGVNLSEVPKTDEMMREMYKEEIEDPSTMQTIFRTNKGYAGLNAPMIEKEDGTFIPKFQYRYLTEDIPFGLCVLKGFGVLAEVETPTIDRVLIWAQEQLGKKYIAGDKTFSGEDIKETAAPQARGFSSLSDIMVEQLREV